MRYAVPAAIATLIVSGLLWSRTRTDSALQAAPVVSVGTPVTTASVSNAARSAETRVAPSPGRTAPPIDPGGGPTLSVRASQVLARVNGTPITGRDLVAFRAGIDTQSFERPTYDLLVRRAIERELTFEAAKKQGVTLNDAQRAQLDQVRKQAAARGGTAPPFDPSTDEIELEARDAEAQLLLTGLLEQAGTPLPSPTPADVETYYRAHENELGALPAGEARAAAWNKIEAEIRRRLSREQQEAWAAKRRELLDSLEAEAAISY